MSLERFLPITDQNGRMHKIDCEPDGYRSFGDVSFPPYKLTLKDGTSIIINDKKEWERLALHKRNYLSGKTEEQSLQAALLLKLAAVDYTSAEKDFLKQILAEPTHSALFLEELKRLFD